MKKFAVKLGASLLALLGFYILTLVLYHWPLKDKDGNRPRDIAKAVMGYVQSNDFQEAATFWGPQCIQNLEANRETKFQDFCLRELKCDSYELGIATRQKEGHFHVHFQGTCAGEKKSFGFYIKRVGGQWRIMEYLWIRPRETGTNKQTVP